MKYALLIYAEPKKWLEADEAERSRVYAQHGSFAQMLNDHNAFLGGEELILQPTTVRKQQDGDDLITDGPFAETVEHLGGFYLVEATDLDQAIEFAKACPGDTIEIRPIQSEPS